MKTLYDYVIEGAMAGDRFCVVGFDATLSKHNYTDDLPLRHPLLKDHEIITLVETPEDRVNGTIRFCLVKQEQIWRGRNTARMLLVEPLSSSTKYLGDLFEKKPENWGYRGDPYLWSELATTLAKTPLPRHVEQLHRLLENAFWEATGTTLAFCEEVKIERFAYGGMSSGLINGEFWRKHGFPLIVRRFLESNFAQS